MKKSKLLMPLTGIAALGAVAPVIAVTSCGKQQTCAVVFILNNGSEPIFANVNKGSTVELPAAPKRSGYTFAGWFTDVECNFMFDETQPIETNTVLYAGWYLDEVITTVPRTLRMPYNSSEANGYTTSKTLEIYEYDEAGQTYTKIDSDDLIFESSRPAVASVDEEGVIQIHPLESNAENATIYAYKKGDTTPIAMTTVFPMETNETITFNNTTHTATYNDYFVDGDGNCVIPETITHNNQEYAVDLVDPVQTSSLLNLYNIENLYLPKGLNSINDSLFDREGTKLQNVYFAGTTTELSSEVWVEDYDWTGPQVVQINCCDGNYGIKGREDVTWKEDYTALATEPFAKSTSKQTRILRFDYSNYGYDLMAANHNVIRINQRVGEGTIANPVDWDAVYLDGELLTNGSDYTVNNTTGQYPTLTINRRLTSSSNLVVKASVYANDGALVIGCVPNFPEELIVSIAPRRQYAVGDIFTVSGLVVKAKWASGETQIIDNELLSFYTDEACTKEIKPGHKFVDVDKFLTKIYIQGIYSGNKASFPIVVA